MSFHSLYGELFVGLWLGFLHRQSVVPKVETSHIKLGLPELSELLLLGLDNVRVHGASPSYGESRSDALVGLRGVIHRQLERGFGASLSAEFQEP